MIIAINDISFRKGFTSRYEAKMALKEFAEVCLALQDERVSEVSAENDILNSPEVNKSTMLAPQYTLIQALREIQSEDVDLFRFILGLLTRCSIEDVGKDTFTVDNISSRFCAAHKNDILLSIISGVEFSEDVVQGILNGTDLCKIRNIAHIQHKYTYWEELGFREYELNQKHGNREYYRAHGIKVGIAPETDALGQSLLNNAIEINGKLYALDREGGDRIFQFYHSYGNKFHAFQNKAISNDVKLKIQHCYATLSKKK
jgi:hypothetical protein